MAFRWFWFFFSVLHSVLVEALYVWAQWLFVMYVMESLELCVNFTLNWLGSLFHFIQELGGQIIRKGWNCGFSIYCNAVESLFCLNSCNSVFLSTVVFRGRPACFHSFSSYTIAFVLNIREKVLMDLFGMAN